MKLTSIYFAFAFFTALLVNGCATTVGTTQLLDQAVLDSLIVGQTTKNEVSAKLGRPLSTNSNGAAGTSQWTYSYSKRALGAIAFIPGASLLSGQHGQSFENINLTVSFDKNGILTDKNISGTQSGG